MFRSFCVGSAPHSRRFARHLSTLNGPAIAAHVLFAVAVTGCATDTEPAWGVDSEAAAASGVSYPVGNIDDDARHNDGSTVIVSTTSLYLGSQHYWMRVHGVSIPAGARITSAKVTFTSKGYYEADASLEIYGQKEARPSQPVAQNGIRKLRRTNASANWSPATWHAEESGPNTTTPDLARIVQEIVDMPDWSKGNSLGLIFADEVGSTGYRKGHAYGSHRGKLAPVLTVSYAGGNAGPGDGGVCRPDGSCSGSCGTRGTDNCGNSCTTNRCDKGCPDEVDDNTCGLCDNRPCSSRMGPLTVHSRNSRYFADGDGNPVYMTSVYTANTLQNVATKPQLNWNDYVRKLVENRINLAKFVIRDRVSENNGSITPSVYPRTGRGRANDGGKTVDLDRLNPVFLDQLRSRAIDLRNKDIYLVVMLFNRFDVSETGGWRMSPYNSDNNDDGVAGDRNKNGTGEETQSGSLPSGFRDIERDRIRAIVDAVEGLPNVIFEVCNETYGGSDWQNWVTSEIERYEASKKMQHPIGQSATWPNGKDNAALFSGRADWISPGGGVQDYENNPPAANGRKVSIVDSDHVTAGFECSPAQIWKYFARGHNPMCYEFWAFSESDKPDFPAARPAMKHTRDYADRMDLARAVPHGELASSRYCLAEPGESYLVYEPSNGRRVTVRLSRGDYRYEWFNPSNGRVANSGAVAGGVTHDFGKPPFSGHAVLFIWR